jgi:hypothetical protein
MTTMNETTTQPMTVKGDSQVAFDDDQNVEQPTGFILKLFQMIHGAPDEVITVSTIEGRTYRILRWFLP